MNRPNILYIHSHDTGRYIQPYGHAVPTPHLQRLAEEGLVFRQAFSAAPTCSPSRASLATGQYPHSNGMLGLVHRGFSLSDPSHHIAHTLKNAGYRTAAAGTQHVAKRSVDIGFDERIPSDSKKAPDVAPAAAAFVARQPAQPFFLSVGFFETHREFESAGPQENPHYCMPPATLPDAPEIREDMAQFKASARVLDEGMGTVLRALDEHGLAENTLVICTTDHGIAFPRAKCNLTDHGIGVLMIMRGPGGFAGGRVTDALVSQVDLFPTICELCGIKAPPWLQGKSLMPLVRGETEQINQEVFAEVNYHAAYEPQRAARTQRFKYIRRLADRATPVLPNTDDSAGKALWLRHGWKTRAVPTDQLYDLVFDPTEAHNLVDDAEYLGVLVEMRELLNWWMRRTNDPLLHGQVSAPPCARVNDTNGLSPNEPTQPVG